MEIFSKRLTARYFLKIVMPATITMIFISCYTVVDGLFIGNFVGETALAAINIVFPILSMIFGFSVMLGAGGAALIGILLGEKKIIEARENFSLITLTAFLVSLCLMGFFFFTMKYIVQLLGASPVLFDDCYKYGIIIAIATPFVMIDDMLEIFLRTDGKAVLSLWMAILAGVLNIFFDYIFIVQMHMGIEGAAWGILISFAVPAVFNLLYFTFKKQGLYFVKPKWRLKILWDTCYNGASEMITRIATGYTTFLFNMVTMQYIGEYGVTAVSIIMYIHFLMISSYLGFSFGVAPIISYNHGARDKQQLKSAIYYSKRFLFTSSLVIFACAIIFAPYVIEAFIGKSSEVFDLATNGLRIYSIAFLFIGFNIFITTMFTAFGNGKISAIVSIIHSFIFVTIGIFLLPKLLGINGIWFAVPFAELMTLCFCYYCFKKYQKIYGY